jgi:hypothetical protein
MVRRDVDLLSPLGAAVSKSVWFCFLGEARGFRLLGIFATTARSLQQHQFVHSRASHASSPPQKVGFSGHYCVAGLIIEGKVVGHHL